MFHHKVESFAIRLETRRPSPGFTWQHPAGRIRALGQKGPARLGTVTDGPTRHDKRLREAEAQRAAALASNVRDLSQLSDDEVMGRAAHYGQAPLYAVVMQRRLKDATEPLTAEITAFRTSSDAAARKVERLTNWLIWFTAALVILTLALVALTAVVAAKG
jgi:hypothetical protein